MFRLVFERAMLRKIDPYVDGRHMRNAIREISTKRDLNYQRRENRSMSIRDLLVHIDTTLRTSKKNFKLGEQRILAVLFFLLLAPAGARPSSILQLRFRDIRVTLARDPHGGHPRLLIEFKLIHVKAYLDPKDNVCTHGLPSMAVTHDPQENIPHPRDHLGAYVHAEPPRLSSRQFGPAPCLLCREPE
jgi:hypothetical protein